MKHGLIFDLDGTLVDSLAGIATSLNHALAHVGLPTHPVTAVRGFIGNGARILIQRGAHPETNVAVLETVESGFKAHYDVSWPEGTAAYPEIARMLESLQEKGYLLAVLSNKPHAFTEQIVSMTFPGIRFSKVLGQRDGIPHKPDPTGALEIARALGLSPESCTLIGDSTIDIETAKNAGMRSIAVTWGFHDLEPLRAAGADFVTDTPEALLDIVS